MLEELNIIKKTVGKYLFLISNKLKKYEKIPLP